MVNEDAAKAQRELTWNQYRKLVAELEVTEAGEEKMDPVNVLKDTLLKVLHEAEQLVSRIQPKYPPYLFIYYFTVQRALFSSAK